MAPADIVFILFEMRVTNRQEPRSIFCRLQGTSPCREHLPGGYSHSGISCPCSTKAIIPVAHTCPRQSRIRRRKAPRISSSESREIELILAPMSPIGLGEGRCVHSYLLVKNEELVLQELHIPEDVLAGCLERYAIRDTAPFKHSHLQGNDAGTEHDPVVHIVDAGGLDC